MFLYERILYEDIITECHKAEIEMIIKSSESKIKSYSDKCGVCIDDIKKQIRLHAPQFKKRFYTNKDFFATYMLPILDRLFDDAYLKTYDEYVKKSGAKYLLQMDHNTLIKMKGGVPYIVPCIKTKDPETNEIHYSYEKYNSEWLPLDIKLVENEIASLIESKLHYLRSERRDSITRIGLFRRDFEYPICYMSYCFVDREDKKIALVKSLGDISIQDHEMIELARVYGCGKLPGNAISFLNGRAMVTQDLKKYNIFITAVNPAIGFTGNSVKGAGFIPYATRPVSYYYNSNGLYCTNRESETRQGTVGVTSMPENILYVKSRNLFPDNTYFKLIDINKNYDANETSIEYRIYEIRNDLEKAWDEKTRYHGVKIVDGEKTIASKGQCGVSSLLLAEILSKDYHYDALFCEGDALFPFEKNKEGSSIDVSIHNHCWIEIDNYNNHGKTVLIDITADQNGYGSKVIFAFKEDLVSRGIYYKSTSRNQAGDVNVEHLRKRLDLLSESMKRQELL